VPPLVGGALVEGVPLVLQRHDAGANPQSEAIAVHGGSITRAAVK
jgi:hypothetical protein